MPAADPGYLRSIERRVGPYWDFFVLSNDVGFDTNLSAVASAFEATTAGSLEFVNTAGATRVVPVETGRRYPVSAVRFLSANSTIAASEVLVYV